MSVKKTLIVRLKNMIINLKYFYDKCKRFTEMIIDNKILLYKNRARRRI